MKWNHLQDYIVSRFKELFSSYLSQFSLIVNLENLNQPMITKEENDVQRRIPTKEGLCSTLTSMLDLQVPKLDGFVALF